jgi:hypothetical protein
MNEFARSMPIEERIAQVRACVADAVRDMGVGLNILEAEPSGPGAEEWQNVQECLDDAAESLRQAALSCVFAIADMADPVEKEGGEPE